MLWIAGFAGLNMTMADGNGAPALAAPNFRRPLKNRTSLARMT
jgi:hypothetical protein